MRIPFLKLYTAVLVNSEIVVSLFLHIEEVLSIFKRIFLKMTFLFNFATIF